MNCKKCGGSCKVIGEPILIDKDTSFFGKVFRIFFMGIFSTHSGNSYEKIDKRFVYVCEQCGHTFEEEEND